MQQHVTLLESSEHVGRLRGFDLGEVRVGRGQEGRVLEFGAIDVGQGEQPTQVQWARHVEDFSLADVQLADQQLEHPRVDVVLDLEPDRWAADLATQQLFFQSEQQILCVVFLDLDVFVAGHSEGVVLHDLHAAEELIEVVRDHVLQRDVPPLGQRDEAGQHARHLDPGELAKAGLRVADQHGEIDRQARDVREGM